MKFTNFILLSLMSIVFTSTSSAIDFKSISKEPKKEKKKIEKKFTKDDIFNIERANILKAGGGYFQSVGFNEIDAKWKIVKAFKNSYNCNVANTITSKSGWNEMTADLIFIFMREIKYHNADVSKGIELDSDDLKKTKKWLPYIKKQARCPDSILEFLAEYDKLTLSLYKDKLGTERKIEQAKNEKIKKQKDEKIKNKAKYERDLKTGVIPIKNIDDASIYYSAEYGEKIVKRTPMQADKNSYRVFGKLVSTESSEFVFEVNSDWNKYYFFGLFKNNQNKLSFETHYSMIGKFVEVKKFKRANGTVGYGPVFQIVYLED